MVEYLDLLKQLKLNKKEQQPKETLTKKDIKTVIKCPLTKRRQA